MTAEAPPQIDPDLAMAIEKIGVAMADCEKSWVPRKVVADALLFHAVSFACGCYGERRASTMLQHIAAGLLHDATRAQTAPMH